MTMYSQKMKNLEYHTASAINTASNVDFLSKWHKKFGQLACYAIENSPFDAKLIKEIGTNL